MSWVITAVVVTGLASSRGQQQAAKQQGFELERQAEQEKIAADSRELARRQELNKVLASNIAGQSTSGVLGEGTPESLSLASAEKASISEGVEGLSDRLKQAQLRRQASNTRTAGSNQALSTLLSTGASALSLSGSAPKAGKK